MSIDGILLFLVGLGVLIVGAELVVRGASRLAIASGISPLVLGLTIVAIGTSAPELAVGIIASAQGSGSMAVGNIAGTNVLNILFILGLGALLRPLPMHLRILKLELPVMLLAGVLLAWFAWDKELDRVDGILMLIVGILYTVALIRLSRRESRAVKAGFKDMYGKPPLLRSNVRQVLVVYSLILLAGIGFSIVGANWLVRGAIIMARDYGISEALIGLTIIAIGTSAPELATVLVAILKDERDVAIGNLLGSSIYNILVILALTCMLSPRPLEVERALLVVDIPMMLGTVLLCFPVFITGKHLSRLEGGLYVSIYLLYLYWLMFFRT